MRTLRIMSAAWVGSLVAAALAQIPPGYHIVQLTDNSWQEDPPKINNHGQIVFARRSGPDGTGEIILYDRKTDSLTQLTNDAVIDLFPDINDDGVIVWTRGVGAPDQWGPTGEIMLRWPDGTTVQLTMDGATDWGPQINALGHVVWYKDVADGCAGSVLTEVFFYDGGSVSQITTDAISAGVANQVPTLNDLDQIVWTKFDFCVDPWESEIWMWDENVSTELTTSQFEPNSPHINNRGTVAWFYRPVPGQHAIQLWQSGVTTDLTDWGSGPVLNELDQIAFIRWHEAEGNWQQWLYRDGQFWQLSDDAFWNYGGDINESGEVAWTSGPLTTANTRYLRRFRSADLNCDGSVNGFDIEPFVVALSDKDAYANFYPACDAMLGDTNADGSLNGFDIESFVQILSQGG